MRSKQGANNSSTIQQIIQSLYIRLKTTVCILVADGIDTLSDTVSNTVSNASIVVSFAVLGFAEAKGFSEGFSQ